MKRLHFAPVNDLVVFIDVLYDSLSIVIDVNEQNIKKEIDTSVLSLLDAVEKDQAWEEPNGIMDINHDS
ncbi:hypothetical protein TNCV_1573161 [Trichonephila clavipes]|uniref:Uncharacterized protein n=1 Tax=Trichonephila clavipes TaxID=2585209 RepID=A0A8X6SPU7_TRICX|nr:hypothetical protein TNCV_1573161 [Trichonephila clavipes]